MYGCICTCTLYTPTAAAIHTDRHKSIYVYIHLISVYLYMCACVYVDGFVSVCMCSSQPARVGPGPLCSHTRGRPGLPSGAEHVTRPSHDRPSPSRDPEATAPPPSVTCLGGSARRGLARAVSASAVTSASGVAIAAAVSRVRQAPRGRAGPGAGGSRCGEEGGGTHPPTQSLQLPVAGGGAGPPGGRSLRGPHMLRGHRPPTAGRGAAVTSDLWPREGGGDARTPVFPALPGSGLVHVSSSTAVGWICPCPARPGHNRFLGANMKKTGTGAEACGSEGECQGGGAGLAPEWLCGPGGCAGGPGPVSGSSCSYRGWSGRLFAKLLLLVACRRLYLWAHKRAPAVAPSVDLARSWALRACPPTWADPLVFGSSSVACRICTVGVSPPLLLNLSITNPCLVVAWVRLELSSVPCSGATALSKWKAVVLQQSLVQKWGEELFPRVKRSSKEEKPSHQSTMMVLSWGSLFLSSCSPIELTGQISSFKTGARICFDFKVWPFHCFLKPQWFILEDSSLFPQCFFWGSQSPFWT